MEPVVGGEQEKGGSGVPGIVVTKLRQWKEAGLVVLLVVVVYAKIPF